MIPCFGTCGGFQHIVIEYARNVLGIYDAEHEEYESSGSGQVLISKLECSLVGRELEIELKTGSMAAAAYGSLRANERYYCNFGVNPAFAEVLRGGGAHRNECIVSASSRLLVSGSDIEGEVRVLEAPRPHPFFVGTLFVPQALSTLEHPHPLVSAFINTSVKSFKEKCK